MDARETARRFEIMERRLREIESRQTKVPLRVPGGGAGASSATSIRSVDALPTVPASGYDVVFWTADSQIWEVYAGQSAWTPRQILTSESGVPV